MKPATFDGSGSWSDYKAHFEVCAQLNGWPEREKGMHLAVSLRDKPRASMVILRMDPMAIGIW